MLFDKHILLCRREVFYAYNIRHRQEKTSNYNTTNVGTIINYKAAHTVLFQHDAMRLIKLILSILYILFFL